MNSSRWAFEIFASHLLTSQYKHCSGCSSLTTEIVLTDCCVRDQAFMALKALQSLNNEQIFNLLQYKPFN